MSVQSCTYDHCKCKLEEGEGVRKEGKAFCDDYCTGSLNPKRSIPENLIPAHSTRQAAAGATVDIRVADEKSGSETRQVYASWCAFLAACSKQVRRSRITCRADT